MARPKSKAKAVPKASPPLRPSTTNRFERDTARMRSRGRDMEKFKAVIKALCSRQPLPAGLRDHSLTGDWAGCRDCHVAPDWIIIYERTKDALFLHRTGTHADLF